MYEINKKQKHPTATVISQVHIFVDTSQIFMLSISYLEWKNEMLNKSYSLIITFKIDNNKNQFLAQSPVKIMSQNNVAI